MANAPATARGIGRHARWSDEVLGEVRTRGFAVVSVPGTAQVPQHSHTVGLSLRDRPDFILFGFSPDVARPVLADLVLRMLDGERFEPNTDVEDLIPGMPIALLEVPDDLVQRFLPLACGLPGARRARALQVVWPDSEDRFPWQRGYSGEWRERQLLLQPGF